MSSVWKNCLLITLVIPLLLLTILSLAGTLVLGVIGIGKAGESNVCISSGNDSLCVPQMTILTSSPVNQSSTFTQRKTIEGEDENEYTYWLAGATGCGILFSIIASLGLWAFEEVLRRIGTTTRNADDTVKIELESKDEIDGAPKSPTPPPESEPVDTIDGVALHPLVDTKVKRRLDCSAFTSLFFSCLCAVFALLSLLWAIAIGYNHTNRVNITVLPFVLVEFLVAVSLPILLCAAVVCMALVLDYVTEGTVDGRSAIPLLLHSVKFKSGIKTKDGTKEDAWIIADTFYFPIKEKSTENREKHGFCFTVYRGFPTWVLITIVCLTFTLAVSYFADTTLDMQISVDSCDDPSINRDFSCFNATTLAFVDCVSDTNVESIHCFRFYRFGVDVDIISALATSYAFYLVGSAFFGQIFMVMKILLHIRKTRLWGALFLIGGLVLLVVSIIVSLFWLTGYASAVIPELTRLNVINLAQFVMISMFVFFAGVLILIGKWVEKKEPTKNDKKEGSGTVPTGAVQS